MAQSHVVSALVAKHAELAGEAQAAEKRVARLRSDLTHLEGALRLFDPEFRPDTIRPKRPVQRDERFAHGELPRLVLDTLRTAPGPLMTREVTRRVMTAKGGWTRATRGCWSASTSASAATCGAVGAGWSSRWRARAPRGGGWRGERAAQWARRDRWQVNVTRDLAFT